MFKRTSQGSKDDQHRNEHADDKIKLRKIITMCSHEALVPFEKFEGAPKFRAIISFMIG